MRDSQQGAVPTGDGSFTFWSAAFGQHYHSTHGAVTESEHVFFNTPGVPAWMQARGSVSIFESGFGTGTNFFLALQHARVQASALHYRSFEQHPLPVAAVRAVVGGWMAQDVLNPWLSHLASLQAGWNVFREGNVVLELYWGTFTPEVAAGFEADFIFHDAFSPDVNPELWSEETFTALKAGSAPHVRLSTYAASVRARAAMCAAGWLAARADGAPGKREMTVAALQPERLDGFRPVNAAHLAARWRSGEWLTPGAG